MSASTKEQKIKNYQKELRKLKKEWDDAEYEQESAEWNLIRIEDAQKGLKEKIKKLKSKP